jgi:hypothetical protein
MRTRLAAPLAAAAIGALAFAGSAQAASAAPVPTARQVVAGTVATPQGTLHAAVPNRPEGVNCGTASLNYDGYQWYYKVACSVWGTSTWTAHISCSNGYTYSAGPYAQFWNVQVYCPHGTTAVQGWVSYTP